MKLFHKGKDGGPESTVTGWWLIEAKNLFSVALLKFEGASREAYHSHAFNSVSWLLKGELHEEFLIVNENLPGPGHTLKPSLKPIKTWKKTTHKVSSTGTSWVLTFRGPWQGTWKEYRPIEDKWFELSDGRKERVLE